MIYLESKEVIANVLLDRLSGHRASYELQEPSVSVYSLPAGSCLNTWGSW